MMTRKNFEVIAACIHDAWADVEGNDQAREALGNLAESLSIEFKAINPAFDADRFLRACGV